MFACQKEKKSTKFCITKYDICFPFVGKDASKQNGTKDLFALAKER
jgi:glutathione peroxidase-family protein